MTIVIGPVISEETNEWIQYLFWFPTFPFSVCAVSLLDKTEIKFFDVNAGVAWFFLIIQCPFYFLLHLYIEAIIPDNFGIRKGLCFCFDSYRKKRNA